VQLMVSGDQNPRGQPVNGQFVAKRRDAKQDNGGNADVYSIAGCRTCGAAFFLGPRAPPEMPIGELGECDGGCVTSAEFAAQMPR
jgi:hypothetical protein